MYTTIKRRFHTVTFAEGESIMLKFKKGVSLKHFTPQIVLAIIATEAIYDDHGFDCTVTSGSDGKHGPRSLHPEGNAFDARIYNIPGYTVDDGWKSAPTRFKIREIVQEVKYLLHHVGFDVVEEVDHIHIEYDPK